VAAKNPVLKVVLPKRVAETIARLAKVGDKSQSGVVREFLVEAEPTMRRVAGLLEIAKAHADGGASDVAHDFEKAVDRLSGRADEVLDRLHEAMAVPNTPTVKPRKKPAARANVGRQRRGHRRRTPAV
jgi:hypothetical protein